MNPQKFPYTRSPALLKACQHCGRYDGTVCAAHSNQAIHGKGRSIKASDVFVASLCHTCHNRLDQGADLIRPERESMWQKAHERTVSELLRLGLWPRRVPFPFYTAQDGALKNAQEAFA